MRNGVFLILSFVFVSFSAVAETYSVPSDGTIAAATTYVNSSSGSDPVTIAISGNQTNTSSTTNIIQHAVDITGTDSAATITGSIAFTRGTGKSSTVSGLTFTGASNTALVNGTGSGNIAGHTMILSDVVFDANVNTIGSQGSAAAILNYGDMTINNGTFTNNSSSSGGAAITNTYDGHLNITGSSFTSNTTTASSGGAIALNSNYEANTITDTSFVSNVANTHGGAIYSVNSDLTLDAAEVKNNTATTGNGGGVYWYGGPSNTLSIKNGSVFDNNTSGKDGGAVNKYANGNSYIDDTIFSNNKVTSGNGGALSTIGNIDSITNTQFINNQTSRMGGGWYSNSTNVSIDNVLFNGNTAGTDGGGLYDYAGLTTISINNTTFSNNISTGGSGGGASVGGDMTISNTTFTNNSAGGAYGGGGLYSTGMDSHLDNVLFDGNSATNGGGLMHLAYTTSGGIKGGVMTIGGNSAFKNNTATQGGGAIFNFTTVNLDTTNGDILFENNSADEGADIYNNSSDPLYGVVNIIGDANTLSMDGGIYGDVKTSVNKTGKNDLVFEERADNTGFTGTFTQNAGTTTVYADNFFGGINNITDGSTLHFVNSADVENLNFETGGILDIRRPNNNRSRAAFAANTLRVGNLSSGNTSSIFMQTDGVTSDLLKIIKTATGDFALNFNVIGSSPTSEKILVVDLTDATTKDADFVSKGVEVGSWKYSLVKETDDNWYLEKSGEDEGDVSGGDSGKGGNGTQHVSAIPALHLSIVKTGLNELRKRLGALRNNNQNEKITGVWIRTYGKNLRVHENNDADMNMYGVEGGVDGMIDDVLGGKLYLGVMAGMMNTYDIDVKDSQGVGGSGDGNAPSVGLYTTWIENNKASSKWFADLTARYFWVHTDIKRNDGLNGYDAKRFFMAFSAEAGRLFYMESPEFMNIGTKQHSHVSIEPKIELRYNYGDSDRLSLDNGMNGMVDSTESFSTHFNLQMNYLPNGTASVWKPFVEFGVYNEFAGKTEMQFGSDDLEASDTSGMGVEFTVGANATINNDTYAYGAITAEVGEVYTSYLANIGVRVKF